MTNKTVWCQVWEESERGWGCRPDGFSLHPTREAVTKYIKEYWDGMPKETPEECSRPCGDPYEVQISENEFKESFKKSANGVRLFGWHKTPARGSVYAFPEEETKK